MIYFHKKFKKDFKKLSQKEKDKFEERLNLFLIDEFNPILNNHPLNGMYEGCRSINVSGDMRAIYEIESTNIRFITIGNHNNLYK
ncbi:MAG: type II toxin-antitoxin system mRNA interferase toxin, RelE/StbE family [Candidatus Pacebacteria bacterium]|jgi:addiction module RelE/StbE family toxin|uniref:type II toxin-antitoxin system RelE/ParE family toxin n=1 Tax=Pseudomonas sp. Kh13 TaxID=2093744 RepID=UPI001181D609|nr:type II toxin-antitoxin system mRNA interferase toxin, RelE/StbE family [Candidatus Paceibacterota bacterium]